MVDVSYAIARAVRLGKSVMPLVMPKIIAFACKNCSTIASVSVMNNKITIKKCRCV